jgi:hypothetical protein
MKKPFSTFMSSLSLRACVGLPLFACGSDTGSDSSGAESNQDTMSNDDAHAQADHPGAQGSAPGDFPAAVDGYTRFTAPVMEDLAPGADVTHCQYIQAPLDRDIDVLDAEGYQSEGGHHAVAFASRLDAPLGTNRVCTDEDNLAQGSFLGGVGGEAGGGTKLPPGVAFRLPKGSSLMLSTHFLNTTDRPLDGHAVVDIKFAEVDPARSIATMFVNGSARFQIPANGPADALAECTMKDTMQVIMFTNHMHDHGAFAKTEIVRADGSVELAHEDPKWTYEMQFKAVYSRWPVEEPLTLVPGDVVRTRCHWENKTATDVQFPREMCFGIGFFLSDGNSSPTCLDGQWVDL